MNPVTDSHLVLQSRAGNRQAYAELIARHQSAVCATAYSVVCDSVLSEDIGQDTFVEAWGKLDQLREPSKVGAWLCSIARTQGLKVLRKRKPAVAIDNCDLPSEQNVEELFEKEQTRALVSAVLERVPESCRSALVLFYREEQSIKEVARALDISEEAAKQRISRGRKEMRAQIEQLVERELCESRPGDNFALGVMGAIGVLPAVGPLPELRGQAESSESADAVGTSSIESSAQSLTTRQTTKQASSPWVSKSVPLWLKLCAAVVICALFLTTGIVLFGSGGALGGATQSPESASHAQVLTSQTQQANALSSAADLSTRAAAALATATDESAANNPVFEGRVLIAGTKQPCIHADVSLDVPDRTHTMAKAFAMTDSKGHFRFEGLGTGDYILRVTCRDRGNAGSSRIVDQYEDLRLPTTKKVFGVRVPEDWAPLLHETIDEAPQMVAERLKTGDVSTVLSDETIQARKRHSIDANADGKLSDEEHQVYEEIISLVTEPPAENQVRMMPHSLVEYRDDAILEVPTKGHLHEGPSDAPVTIINVANFGSPFCHKAQLMLKQLQADYPAQLQVVTRIRTGSPEPRAAELAYCAAMGQHKAAEFIDIVWREASLGRDFSEKNMLRIADLIGANGARFRSDMNSTGCSARIEKYTKELDELGLRATPTWVINGQVVRGVRDMDHYRKVIDEKLEQAAKN